MGSEFAQLCEIVARNVEALLSVHGLAAERAPDAGSPERARWIMASIGFSGSAARGALTIVASTELWRKYALTTAQAGDLSEAFLADMAGELANMVLGRTRNDLTRLGVTVHSATPTCAFGEDIHFRDPGQAQVRWQRFVTPTGQFSARVDAHLEEGFVLEPNGDPAVESYDAEAVLFF